MELIRLVDPVVIMLAGAAAVESVLRESRPMSKIRGQWFPWNGRWVMPVFHPAYLLRNQSRAPGSPKALMWTDIREVRRVLTEQGALAADGGTRRDA
jgi:DNA polymerase